MTNGVKIGLLVVIAGVLGLIAFKMTSESSDEISTRQVESPTTTMAQQKGANPTEVGQGEASKARAKTSIQFEKMEHDYGTIKQGESPETIFKFTNTGNEPLIIETAKGSCGCTVPEWPKDPIAPGGKGEIKVQFNSAGKSGDQSKSVTLTANTDPLNTVLTIKAKVDVPADAEKGSKK